MERLPHGGYGSLPAGPATLPLLLFVVGFYTGTQFSVSAAMCGQALGATSRLRGSGQAEVLFSILIASAVYIECAALALGFVATLMVGSLLAAVAGPTAGMSVATRLAARQA